MATLNTRKRGKLWEWRFEKAPINGKRQQASKGGYKTKAEAVKEGTKALNEYYNTGRTFDSNEMSVADYLDYWLENVIKQNIGTSYTMNTYRDYESRIRIHLKPAFGEYRLGSFQFAPDKVQEWIDKMKSNGYAKSMVKNTLACLSGAMNYAVVPLNYIQVNPCIYVKVGKMPINKKAQEKTEYILSRKDYKQILERFPESSNFYLSLLVPYNTGTRLSETFGIDLYKDVDFVNHTLTISQQMYREGGQWFYRPPKYDSYRTIKIGQTLEKALKAEILNRKKTMLQYGQYFTRTYVTDKQQLIQLPANVNVPYREVMPLCVKENGELLTPDSFKYCAKVIHHELGNPLFHSHCLRHTHGTILAENGVNPKTVMERLGHKDITTTLQIYTFNTDKMISNAVDIFENIAN